MLWPQIQNIRVFNEAPMDRSSVPAERAAHQVKENLDPDSRGRRRLTGAAVRAAAVLAAKRTRSASRGASNLARETVEGAVLAVAEIGGETGAFVRDSVIGVVEGTGQVVTVTRPAVREVVVGAIRGAGGVSAEVGEVGRDAVEGAIVGATSVGIDSAEAASAAVDGAVEAVVEVGGDLEDAAKATVGGVVSGVVAAGGDVAAATRDATHTLITYAADSERSPAEITGVAGRAVDAVLEEAEGTDFETDDVIVAAATGAVEAAYQVGQSHGDRVRQSVVRRMLEPRLTITPDLERQLSGIAERLSDELPRGRAAWRGTALIKAVRLLVQAGGIDLAASLAYFTILSFLPLIALVVMAVAIFTDPEGVRETLTEILVHYFPASADLIREAVENLLNGSLVFGLVALVGMVLGANGLFMAANRSVSRVFGIEPRNVMQITVTEMAVATSVAVLFLLSLALTALLQVAVSFSEGIAEVTGGVSAVAVVVFGVVSTVVPAVLTAAVFAVVYRRLPNVEVEWRNATFGAMVAIVLFEIGKHLFFWFTNLSSQRNAVYGPAASVIVLMMWGYIASLIFLYGAALVKVAGETRPASFPKTAR